VVNESAEGESRSPGVGEVLNFHVIVFSGPALAPDQDGLHLGGHHLGTAAVGPADSELQCDSSMGSHPSSLRVRVEAR